MSKASVYFTVENADGKHDVKEIKRGLDTLPGVSSVSVNSSSGSVAVDFDTTGVQRDRIQKHLENLGYNVLDVKSEQL